MGCDRGPLAQRGCGSHRLRTNFPARPWAHASPDPLLAVGGPKSPHRASPETRRSKTAPAGSAVTRGPFVKNRSAERSTCSGGNRLRTQSGPGLGADLHSPTPRASVSLLSGAGGDGEP